MEQTALANFLVSLCLCKLSEALSVSSSLHTVSPMSLQYLVIRKEKQFTFKKSFLLRSDFFGKRLSKGRTTLEVGVLTESYLLENEVVSRLWPGNKGRLWDCRSLPALILSLGFSALPFGDVMDSTK